jgi:ribonucleotide reductase alpha subunit
MGTGSRQSPSYQHPPAAADDSRQTLALVCAGLAELHGPYSTYAGSPASEGKLQFDLWGVTPSARFDWADLKARIAKHGLRNSLLLAPMPTASTAQILGNNESFEPFTSNIYNRRVLAGEFPVVNRHLLKDLIERGLWNPMTRNLIIAVRHPAARGEGGGAAPPVVCSARAASRTCRACRRT